MKGFSAHWAWFAVFAAVFVALPSFIPSGPVTFWLQGVSYLLIAAMAVLATARATSVTSGIEKRAWTYLALAVGLLAAGDAIWIIGEGVSGGAAVETTPGIPYVFYVLAYVPLTAYVLTVLSAALSGAPFLTKGRYILDLTIAILLIGALAFLFILSPSYAQADPAEYGIWWLNTVISILGVFAAVSLLASLLESREQLWMRWEAKVTAAIVLVVISDVVYDTVAGMGISNAFIASLTDVLWMSAYFTLAMAASQRYRSTLEIVNMPTMAHARRGRLRWYDFGVAALLLSLVPYVLFEARSGHLTDTQFWGLGIASFVLALLVIARSIVLTSENGNLLSHTVVDPLTGAYNHRFFQERVSVEVDRARRSGEPFTVALLDIDDFGSVNERMGHSRGDQCLVRVSELVRMHERVTDTVCRLGGDEFALIMPATDSASAVERIQQIQEAIAVDRELDGCISTASVGIATYPDHASDRTALVAKADGALYWAQATGVGQVVVYDDDVVEALSPEERLHLTEEQSYMSTVESLAAAVDARDRYTQFHSRNVARLASVLALELGFDENRVKLIEIAGLLHDVGKIGISDTILRKPGRLTDEERLKIEEHPDLGQRILSATIFKEILPWVLSHHERWDGSGYPQGLVGEEAPLEARILSVCDAYDAMVSDRPYRNGLPPRDAVLEIERNLGTQFDPYIASVFIALHAEGAFAETGGESAGAVHPLDVAFESGF